MTSPYEISQESKEMDYQHSDINRFVNSPVVCLAVLRKPHNISARSWPSTLDGKFLLMNSSGFPNNASAFQFSNTPSKPSLSSHALVAWTSPPFGKSLIFPKVMPSEHVSSQQFRSEIEGVSTYFPATGTSSCFNPLPGPAGLGSDMVAVPYAWIQAPLGRVTAMPSGAKKKRYVLSSPGTSQTNVTK